MQRESKSTLECLFPACPNGRLFGGCANNGKETLHPSIRGYPTYSSPRVFGLKGFLEDARYGVYNHTAVNPFPGNSDCFELGLAILILCSLFEPLFVSNSEY